ncbi:MAG TPA: hypothetical protein VD838_21290, partial [Anaeromyxobacteraceae bacterium]|nr:hypothetical protein [Anaeromyxobacteraceae bacterium]
MTPPRSSPRSARRRDRAGARTLVAVAASTLVNAVAFGWGLSSDMLRDLRDRERVRRVAVASLTDADWEANREIQPAPNPRPPRRPPVARPEERQATAPATARPAPPTGAHLPAARPPVAAAPAP